MPEADETAEAVEEELRPEPQEAETPEADQTQEADLEVGVAEDPATLMGLPAMPVESTGNSVRGRGTVLTGTTAHGATTKVQNLTTTGTSCLKWKSSSETTANLTS